MRKIILLFTFFSFSCFYSQNYELKNPILLQYYKKINSAEEFILENKLDSALVNYKSAFSIFKNPHSVDIYNSLKVALKTKDNKWVEEKYQLLKCMGYSFDDEFLAQNEDLQKIKKDDCKIKINFSLKKSFDSLFVIDQHYRNLSIGDYTKYKKEITTSDSIAATKLLKLIQKNGFPNEYDIGVNSFKNNPLIHQFYYIIWHQAQKNKYSPQQVNFSKEIEKALNNGKITPYIAGFLIDLNDGTNNFHTEAFAPHGFVIGDVTHAVTMIKAGNTDECCYITKYYFPENRNQSIDEKIEHTNISRKKIGLNDILSESKKSLFLLKNKDFIFPTQKTIIHAVSTNEDVDEWKKRLYLIKIE